MATPELTPDQLAQIRTADPPGVFRVVDTTSGGVLYAGDDIFLKKIFESDARKAFELLFNKYYNVLCNHAVRFLYSKQKAEDIVADTFVVIWNRRLYLNVRTSFRTYLFTAVRNKCCTYLKWELKKELTGDLNDIEIESQTPTPEQILQASDLHVKIEQTIIGLPPRQQQVFVMSRFEGKTNNQIAAALDLSIKTVEMHISKSLARFRAALGE